MSLYGRFCKLFFEKSNSFVIFGELCFNLQPMTTDKQVRNVAGTQRVPAKARLRVQPLASDAFSTLSYSCIMALLFFELLALFWLDIF